MTHSDRGSRRGPIVSLPQKPSRISIYLLIEFIKAGTIAAENDDANQYETREFRSLFLISGLSPPPAPVERLRHSPRLIELL